MKFIITKNKVKQKIKRLFSDIPFLYLIYFRFVRNRKGLPVKFFDSKTEFYFDAYPRSGNTFFAHLVKKILPNKSSVHHLHKLAPLKIALRRKLVVFIIYRNPTECISSNYLKHYSMREQPLPENTNILLIEHMVEEYHCYYKFVLSNNEKLHLIDFEELIERPANVMKSVSKQLGVPLGQNKIHAKVEEHRKTYKSSTTEYGSSKPSKTKEEEKSKVKKNLLNIPKYKDCQRIFTQLSELS